MKRCSSALVTYPSSDEDEKVVRHQPVKKRKLPSLSPSLLTPIPVDNPAYHQGRIRTEPHVEGQFVAHIYVSINLERGSALHKLLDAVLSDSKGLVPTLHEVWSTGEQIGPSTNLELHISLSRPTYLRAHQREDLKRAVKTLAKTHRPFPVSFATFSELSNDTLTRTFLAMEVGAGHHELCSLSDALTPALQAIRQKEFYSNPRFHASIAWALLDRPPDQAVPATATAGKIGDPLASVLLGAATLDDSPTTPIPDPQFLTIPHLPKTLVPTLNERFGASLSSTKVGAFDADEISVKIGKQVSSWHLTGI